MISIEEEMKKAEEELLGKCTGQIPADVMQEYKREARKVMLDYMEQDKMIRALTYQHSLTSSI